MKNKDSPSSRQIENILALFEATISESGTLRRSTSTSCKSAKGDIHCPHLHPSITTTPGSLRERIRAFERAHDESLYRRIAAARRDWESLEFEDLPSRKSTLLESLQAWTSTPSTRVAQELAFIRPRNHEQRRMDRRASTGRVSFGDLQNETTALWECRDAYAAQLQAPQKTIDPKGQTSKNKMDKDTRNGGLQRRHSTGCLAELDDQPNATNQFWQVYEQDENLAPQEPMKKRFTRRRTVRFAPHVTVFVFSKEHSYRNVNKDNNCEALHLPRSFLRETSQGDEYYNITPRRKKLMSENRFSSTNTSQAPVMPGRNGSGRGHCSPQLPSRIGSTLSGCLSPPKQPQRQLTSRQLVDTLPKQPKRLDGYKSERNVGCCCESPKKPERQPTNHDPSPKKPMRQNTIRNLTTVGSSRKPIRQDSFDKLHSYFVVNGLVSPPSQQPEGQPTNHDTSSLNDKHDDLVRSFHASRGSRASKTTLMYDSFGECSATFSESSSTNGNGNTESDVESIDSSMFSAEQDQQEQQHNEWVQYVPFAQEQHGSKNKKQQRHQQRRRRRPQRDSEDCRRERVLMWYRRLAMPSYHMMKHHVRTTPGLGITLDDVDLLPWSTTNATYRLG